MNSYQYANTLVFLCRYYVDLYNFQENRPYLGQKMDFNWKNCQVPYCLTFCEEPVTYGYVTVLWKMSARHVIGAKNALTY